MKYLIKGLDEFFSNDTEDFGFGYTLMAVITGFAYVPLLLTGTLDSIIENGQLIPILNVLYICGLILSSFILIIYFKFRSDSDDIILEDRNIKLAITFVLIGYGLLNIMPIIILFVYIMAELVVAFGIKISNLMQVLVNYLKELNTEND